MKLMRVAKAAFVGGSLAVLVTGQTLAAATGPARRARTAVRQVEPAAVNALARMSAYLRSTGSFLVTSDTQRDEVDAAGHLVTFFGQATYRVKAPNAFTISVVDGSKARDYIYDGKSVTVYDPATRYYTRFNAPPTIRQTLDLAASRYGVTVPLDDLFHWDQSQTYAAKLTAGHYVGETAVNGQQAEQYVFSQPGVDWQIWIAKGDKPTPLRVVIVASKDPSRPRFEANLAWQMTPQFASNTFVFTPPSDAKAIPIDTVGR